MLRVLSVDTTMLPMHFFEVPDDDSGWTQTLRMSIAIFWTADILSTFWTGFYENSKHSRLTFRSMEDDDSGWTQTFRMSVAVLRTADILSTFWTGLYENSRHSRLTCRSIEDSAELLIFEFAFLT